MALGPAWRVRRLDYDGRCGCCGRRLSAGDWAHWRPGDDERVGALTCRRCEPLDHQRDGTADGRSEWQRLVDYYTECLLHEARIGPVPYDDPNAWSVVTTDEETLLLKGRRLVLDTPLAALFAKARANEEEVYYGWPTAIVRDRQGEACLAPLFMIRLARPSGELPEVDAADPRPQLNLGLLDERFLGDTHPAEILELVDTSELASCGAAELVERATELAGLLGLETFGLDPERLSAEPLTSRAGLHNTACAIRGRTTATIALLGDLDALGRVGDWQQTAARHFLADAPEPQRAYADLATLANPLNAAQETACDHVASGSPLVVVTGPPGTGKTEVVGAIVLGAWARGETVLVATTNNEPVDEAVRKVAGIHDALLLRAGNRNRLADLADTLGELLRDDPGPDIDPPDDAASMVAHTARRQVYRELAQRAALEHALAELTPRVSTLREQVWRGAPRPAVDRSLARGLRQAADARALGAVRRRRALAQLATAPSPRVALTRIADWAEAEVTQQALIVRLRALPPRDTDAERLRETGDAWTTASRDRAVGLAKHALSSGREALALLRDTLANPQTSRSARHAAVEGAMSHARGWACTALSVAPSFALEAGLFDLAIIDEASQTNLAHALPIAYRAKRLVVVGDPQQLRPVVTLGEQAHDAAARRAGLDTAMLVTRRLSYRGDSAYTAMRSRISTPPVLLEEHFRCHPHIARFIDEQFYDGRLVVLTDTSAWKGMLQGIEWVDVAGGAERISGGSWINAQEVEHAVALCTDLVGELGVVTPFRGQAVRCRAMLRARPEIRNVMAATAHAFQGGQRETMILSPVAATGLARGSAGWIHGNPHLLNVAVSRARRLLVVAGDPAAGVALGIDVLDALAVAAREPRPEIAPPLRPGLAAALATTPVAVDIGGYPARWAWPSAQQGGVILEIDAAALDPDGRRRRQSLTRDAVIERLGWRVVRVAQWEVDSAPDHVASLLGEPEIPPHR
jgi:AAA domain